jgi:hypothetical protein
MWNRFKSIILYVKTPILYVKTPPGPVFSIKPSSNPLFNPLGTAVVPLLDALASGPRGDMRHGMWAVGGLFLVALGVVAAAPQRRLRLDEERRLKEAAGDINGVV